MTFRNILIAAGVGYALQRGLPKPYGPASAVPEELRPKYSDIDETNDSLRLKHGKTTKIYERVEEGQEPLMHGPETVLFDPNGDLFVLTEDAKLVKLDSFHQENDDDDDYKMTAKATEILHLGVGRPLGGKFAADGTLYIADAHLGLLRVQHPISEHKVELIASRVKDTATGNYSQILYCNDVAVGPKTNKVYFTDSTDIAPDRIGTRTWDTMYMAKLDFVRGKRTGRLLEYDPATDQVKILASNLWFANGVAVDKDETFVMISETFQTRALKYHLQGSKKGQLEVMNKEEAFPGYPDGADCSWTTGLCYAPMPSAALKLMKKVYGLAHPTDIAIRNLLMAIPRWLAPKVVPYGGVVELFPGNDKEDPHITQILQDPSGADIGMLTGATVHNDKLYLGSLRNDYIGVYALK